MEPALDLTHAIDHVRRMAAFLGRPVAARADRQPVGSDGRASSVAVGADDVMRPRVQFEIGGDVRNSRAAARLRTQKRRLLGRQQPPRRADRRRRGRGGAFRLAPRRRRVGARHPVLRIDAQPPPSRLRIDVQALSPNPGQYCHHVDADLCRAATPTVDDAAAARPERFVGMGTVPLQYVHVRLAVGGMRCCVGELDLRGIEIPSRAGGVDHHDPRFQPFFAAAEEVGVLLFILTPAYRESP